MALFSLPSLELARFRRSGLTKLALVVAVVLPATYAGVNIAANWNPTGRLGNLTGAVVNLDQPVRTTAADGSTSTVAAGRQLTASVTAKDAAGLTWRQVTDPRQAADGLRDGTYAAVLTIPATFSADLTSVGGDRPRPARISVVSDDAQNYLLGTVVTTLTGNLRDGLAVDTTERYLDNVYVGFNTVHGQVHSAAGSATELADGATSTAEGSDQLVVGLGDLRTGAGELSHGTAALRTGAGRLADGTATLADGARTAATGAATLSTGLGTLHTGSSQLPQQTRRLADGATTVAGGADRVADGTAELAAGVGTLTAAIDGAPDAPAALKRLQTTLSNASGTVADARSTLHGDVLTRLRRLAAANPSDPELQRLLDDVERLEARLDPALGGAVERLDQAAGTAGRLADGAQRLTEGLRTIGPRVDQLAAGARTVATGADQVAAGNRRLAQAAPALAGGIRQADTGARRLAAGTGQLSTAAAGAARGASGLSDGAARVDLGAHRLATGTGDARRGAERLADGTHRVADGSGRLADGLRTGADRIPTYDDADRANRSTVAARPVSAERIRENRVSHNGAGLAPLYLALALWIGGMVTYLLLRAVSPRALASTASTWRVAFSGWLPGGVLALAQGALAVVVLHVVVGLDPPDLAATTAFAVLTAGVFAAVHQCLNALFGGVGRLVALLLLIVQLAAAGATYPVQTSPGVFAALHPYLPLSYAVQGLRHLVAGGSTAAVWTSVAALSGFGVGAFALTLLACRQARTWSITRLHPSLSL